MRARVWSLVMGQVDQIATRAASSPRCMEILPTVREGIRNHPPWPSSENQVRRCHKWRGSASH